MANSILVYVLSLRCAPSIQVGKLLLLMVFRARTSAVRFGGRGVGVVNARGNFRRRRRKYLKTIGWIERG